MKVFRDAGELAGIEGPVHLAIGVFDGVHVGHGRVIRRALQGAERDGGSAVVVTFDPHPAVVLRPELAPVMLTPLAQKLELLAELGVDGVLVQAFDAAFAGLEAEAFVERLVDGCRPLKHVAVGYDWKFGKGRRGDVHLLAELGRSAGFEFTAVPAVEVDGVVVRSTLVREAVSAGDLGVVASYLGREYAVRGVVVAGDRRGRELGFPTMNLDVENELLPPVGVYAVRAVVDGKRRNAVANLGVKPTFSGGGGTPVLEVHVPDWEGEVYGETVEVAFAQRLRGERAFDGVEALKAQIAEDVRGAVAVLTEEGS